VLDRLPVEFLLRLRRRISHADQPPATTRAVPELMGHQDAGIGPEIGCRGSDSPPRSQLRQPRISRGALPVDLLDQVGQPHAERVVERPEADWCASIPVWLLRKYRTVMYGYRRRSLPWRMVDRCCRCGRTS
jgi:hypothetical protein